MMRARGEDGERVAKRLVLSLKFATETGAALCFSRMISGFRFVNAGSGSMRETPDLGRADAGSARRLVFVYELKTRA
jgi:hypothetical protein